MLIDITDAWQQETDPENERGEICIGSFTRAGLDSLIVTGRVQTILPREIVALILSADEIKRLEQYAATVMKGKDDDAGLHRPISA